MVPVFYIKRGVTMKIYVMRHGRTGDNASGIMNGRSEEDIIDDGIAQAEKARDKFNKLDVDLIICSTMLRARHTAEIVNKDKNLPVIFDERLVERDSGEMTGKPITGDFRDAYWNFYSTKFDVEHVPKLIERIYPVVDEIKEKYADKNIMIVTHKGVGRAIYCYFNGLPDDGNLIDYGAMDNCEIVEFNI